MKQLHDNITDTKVRYILENYLEVILREFEPSELWLWGSRIYGTPHAYSDVDMVLVSERFRGLNFFERRRLFREVTGIYDDAEAEDVDVLCYTSEEFSELSSEPTVIREAVEKGLRVA